jgi:hypothetical protein
MGNIRRSPGRTICDTKKTCPYLAKALQVKKKSRPAEVWMTALLGEIHLQ